MQNGCENYWFIKFSDIGNTYMYLDHNKHNIKYVFE